MDVNKKIDVSIPMDGKSKSTIQITISWICVDMEISV
jgi:hypothetical protein